MKALLIERFGPLSGLRLVERPEPVPVPDEVRVRVHAAAINPSDVKNVLGQMPGTTLPRVPGRDFAGVVAEGPDELIGTEVWGTGGDLGFTRDGTHAESVVLPREAVRPKPRHLSFEEAGAAGLPYVTAWATLIEAAGLSTGEIVVVIGAAGAVGSAALQLARWKGACVIGAIRDPPQSDQVREAGAAAAVSTQPDEFRDAVLGETNGHGADVILDTVEGVTFELALSALARRGRLVVITAPAEPRVSFNLRDFYHREARLFGVDTRNLDARTCARILDQVAPGFEARALEPPRIAERYPLEDGVRAYERVEGGVSGKVLLVPFRER